MKRRILILALALVAVTAAIGTTVASLLPVTTAVYIYEDEATLTGLKFVANYDLQVSSSGSNVTVNITDARENPPVPTTRIARTSTGAIIKVSGGTTTVTAPNNVVID